MQTVTRFAPFTRRARGEPEFDAPVSSRPTEGLETAHFSVAGAGCNQKSPRAAARSACGPARTSLRCLPMDPQRFEELVDEAVAALPPEFARRLDNVDVVVEEAPARRLLRRMGLGPGRTLLGLYEGVPQTRRTHAYGAVLPDRIVIYRRPVLAEARQHAAESAGASSAGLDEAVRDVVRATVLHEIGHHFGLSEADLEKYED